MRREKCLRGEGGGGGGWKGHLWLLLYLSLLGGINVELRTTNVSKQFIENFTITTTATTTTTTAAADDVAAAATNITY